MVRRVNMIENKLAMIEACIQNDLRSIEELQWHLTKLYELRAEELAARGISEEEWEQLLKEKFHGEH